MTLSSGNVVRRLRASGGHWLKRAARLAIFVLWKSRIVHVVRKFVFNYLPFEISFNLTIWFRHIFKNGSLDRHFIAFCGPEIASHLEWIIDARVTRRFPDEVSYYLLLSGRRVEALQFFRASDWSASNAKISSSMKGIDPYGSIYSMDLLIQIHSLDWHKLIATSYQLRALVRLMLEHQNFQFEERVFFRHIDAGEVAADATVEQYIPHFYMDREVVDRLTSEMNLPDNAGILATLDAAKRPWERLPNDLPDRTLYLDIYMYYAYRNLLLRTYHNGEGNLVPLVYSRSMRTQRRLRLSLPKPSPELKRVLDGIGVELPDVRLLSPDWSALIGHNGHLAVHLMMREMGWWKGAPVLLAYQGRIANQTFLSLFADICPTLTLGANVSPAAWHELASLMPFLGDSHQAFEFEDGRCVYWNDAGSMALQQWERDGRGFPLRDIYDAKMRADGRTEMLYQGLRKKWGLGPNDWFVCLHMRDADTRGEKLGSGESIRSAAVDNYMETIRHITEMGGWVVRMGGRKVPSLPEMPRLIDYARSDDQVMEMDIHLVRRARIFIGTTSGFAYVASSFGIPTAMVNALSSVGLLWSKDTRFALKRVHTREGRMLSLSDVTSEKWRWTFPTYETAASAGLTVSESSADEILETTKEVLDLTSGQPRKIDSIDDSWERCLNIRGFFGSSRPARYFLEKYSSALLAK